MCLQAEQIINVFQRWTNKQGSVLSDWMTVKNNTGNCGIVLT